MLLLINSVNFLFIPIHQRFNTCTQVEYTSHPAPIYPKPLWKNVISFSTHYMPIYGTVFFFVENENQTLIGWRWSELLYVALCRTVIGMVYIYIYCVRCYNVKKCTVWCSFSKNVFCNGTSAKNLLNWHRFCFVWLPLIFNWNFDRLLAEIGWEMMKISLKIGFH